MAASSVIRSILFLAIGCASVTIHATTLRDSIPPGKNFEKAGFQLWYPDQTRQVEGIVVLMPGSNEDGRSWSEDPFWQKLARKHNLALLGCYFTDAPHPEMNIEYYANVREGSGDALLTVINRFAAKSKLPSLAAAPLLFWGHSAGGEYNYEFACWKPERVMAFVVNKGGFYYTGLAPSATRSVPGLFFIGEKDMESRNDIIKGLFMMNRRVGALWTFAPAPGAEHEIGLTQKLAGLYFDEILTLKANRKSWTGLSEGDGNTGNFKSRTLVQKGDSTINPFVCSWLPTSGFATAWLSFISNQPF